MVFVSVRNVEATAILGDCCGVGGHDIHIHHSSVPWGSVTRELSEKQC
jgi:hypothetical protein